MLFMSLLWQALFFLPFFFAGAGSDGTSHPGKPFREFIEKDVRKINAHACWVNSLETMERVYELSAAYKESILKELFNTCNQLSTSFNITCNFAQLQTTAQIQTLRDQQILTNETFTLLDPNTPLPKSADKLATQAVFMGGQGVIGIEQSAIITDYISLWTEGWTVGMLCQCPYGTTIATKAPAATKSTTERSATTTAILTTTAQNQAQQLQHRVYRIIGICELVLLLVFYHDN